MHEHRHDATVESGDAAVVAEEYAWVGSERFDINLAIDERLPAVNAAREGDARLRARQIAPIVIDDVHRAVNRIDRHPGEELLFSILERVVVHSYWLRPRYAAVA